MFKVVPILERMLEFYQLPPNQERFDLYIKMLRGNSKSDMELPIGGYNPMAKAHVSENLRELIALNAEELISEILVNVQTVKHYEVVINVADDLLGGWTNRYTTDYQSKFQLNPLIERGFCTPYFWSSEKYSLEIITERALAQAYRTMYFAQHHKPVSLKDHVEQERSVAQSIGLKKLSESPFSKCYSELKNTEDYAVIIAFLYGDEAAESLGFSCLNHAVKPMSLQEIISL